MGLAYKPLNYGGRCEGQEEVENNYPQKGTARKISQSFYLKDSYLQWFGNMRTETEEGTFQDGGGSGDT